MLREAGSRGEGDVADVGRVGKREERVWSCDPPSVGCVVC